MLCQPRIIDKKTCCDPSSPLAALLTSPPSPFFRFGMLKNPSTSAILQSRKLVNTVARIHIEQNSTLASSNTNMSAEVAAAPSPASSPRSPRPGRTSSQQDQASSDRRTNSRTGNMSYFPLGYKDAICQWVWIDPPHDYGNSNNLRKEASYLLVASGQILLLQSPNATSYHVYRISERPSRLPAIQSLTRPPPITRA